MARARVGLVRVGGADQREASGDEERGGRALDGAREDEGERSGSGAAERGGDREEDYAREEDALPTEAITEGAADEDEGREEERVGLHDPLRVGRGDAEIALDHRERDVHDGPVEERHAGARDRDEKGATHARHRGGISSRGTHRASRPRSSRAK